VGSGCEIWTMGKWHLACGSWKMKEDAGGGEGSADRERHSLGDG
jgi:hypothetical protein